MHKITNDIYCLYSLPYQFAWVKIQKIASTAIEETIRSGAMGPTIQMCGQEYASRLRDIDGFLVTAFVRDPVERLCSAYSNLALDAESERITQWLGSRPSWETFLDAVLTQDLDTCDIHWKRQSVFLRDEQGKLIPNDIRSFSRIQQEWEELRKLRPLPSLVRRRIGRVNKPEVTEEQLKRIRLAYHDDLKLLEK